MEGNGNERRKKFFLYDKEEWENVFVPQLENYLCQEVKLYRWEIKECLSRIQLHLDRVPPSQYNTILSWLIKELFSVRKIPNFIQVWKGDQNFSNEFLTTQNFNDLCLEDQLRIQCDEMELLFNSRQTYWTGLPKDKRTVTTSSTTENNQKYIDYTTWEFRFFNLQSKSTQLDQQLKQYTQIKNPNQPLWTLETPSWFSPLPKPHELCFDVIFLTESNQISSQTSSNNRGDSKCIIKLISHELLNSSLPMFSILTIPKIDKFYLYILDFFEYNFTSADPALELSMSFSPPPRSSSAPRPHYRLISCCPHPASSQLHSSSHVTLPTDILTSLSLFSSLSSSSVSTANIPFFCSSYTNEPNSSPLLSFELTSKTSDVYCSIQSFSSESNTVFIPLSVYNQLNLSEANDTVLLSHQTLPLIHQATILSTSDSVKIEQIEWGMRNYTVLNINSVVLGYKVVNLGKEEGYNAGTIDYNGGQLALDIIHKHNTLSEQENSKIQDQGRVVGQEEGAEGHILCPDCGRRVKSEVWQLHQGRCSTRDIQIENAKESKCKYCKLHKDGKEEHHEQQCGEITVECSFGECNGKRVRRKDIKEHMLLHHGVDDYEGIDLNNDKPNKQEERTVVYIGKTYQRNKPTADKANTPALDNKTQGKEGFLCDKCTAVFDEFHDLQVHVLVEHFEEAT